MESMHSQIFFFVDAHIPDETMPAIYYTFIATYWANPVNPVILGKMDIQSALA